MENLFHQNAVNINFITACKYSRSYCCPKIKSQEIPFQELYQFSLPNPSVTRNIGNIKVNAKSFSLLLLLNEAFVKSEIFKKTSEVC